MISYCDLLRDFLSWLLILYVHIILYTHIHICIYDKSQWCGLSYYICIYIYICAYDESRDVMIRHDHDLRATQRNLPHSRKVSIYTKASIYTFTEGVDIHSWIPDVRMCLCFSTPYRCTHSHIRNVNVYFDTIYVYTAYVDTFRRSMKWWVCIYVYVLHVVHVYLSNTHEEYRVVKTQRMPYLYRSFFTKEPYN